MGSGHTRCGAQGVVHKIEAGIGRNFLFDLIREKLNRAPTDVETKATNKGYDDIYTRARTLDALWSAAEQSVREKEVGPRYRGLSTTATSCPIVR